MRYLIAFAALGSTLLAQTAPVKYPIAPPGNVVDDYHGTKVHDPYRWLEDLDSPETRAWVDAENALTFGFLEKLPEREKFKARLTKLWDFPRYGLPYREAGHYFFSKNDGLQNQAVLYIQDGLHGSPRVLLDPNLLSADGTVALTANEASHDGQWLAYGTAAAGSDWNEFHIRSTATGQDTGDIIKWVKFSGLSWTRDSRGFFYSRFPASEGGGEKTFDALEHQRVYYHRLGTEQAADRLVFEVADQPKWLVGGGTTEDGRYLVLSTRRGDSRFNLLRVVDLQNPLAPQLDGPAIPLVDQWQAEYQIIGNSGPIIYMLTTQDAPRRRIVAVDARSPSPANWRTLVPEGADVIGSAGVVGGKFIVVTMHDASSRLLSFSLEGKPGGEIPLPGLGTVFDISGKQDEPELFYGFTSYTVPSTIFRQDLGTGRSEVFRAPQIEADLSRYITEEIFYNSKDGTRVPMFITHRRGVKPDPATPAILYAYGGFDISLTPGFSISTLAWLEQGGIYAVPNLRGGGEYGREWHDAGTKERKQNVFNDYIAAAEWLFANQYTSPAHLVLSGGSNGGLLVGAVLNQRPDLCRVAWPAVGVMDMLRFQKFTVGYAWVSDYGSSDDPEGFKYLSAYSPLHTIKAGAKYPAVLVTTADHDDRVFPAHSFKYTAALQAAVAERSDAGPVLIRIETRAGHGAGKPTAKVIDEIADKFAFAAHFLGMDVR